MDLRPACRKLPGLNRETWITNFRPTEKNTNYALLVRNFGAHQRKTRISPRLSESSGLNREKTWISPRLSEKTWITPRGIFRPGPEKNMDFAPLVRNFRGSTEKKHGFRPACQKLPGSTEKNVNSMLSEFRQQRKRKLQGYNKCRDAPPRKDVPFAVDVRFETTIRNEPRYS